jgi:5-methyltetrahydropteroyltriglutamate--homocysteine methyltransferase
LTKASDLVDLRRDPRETDDQIGTWVGQAAVDPDVVWAKLTAMAEVARLATTQFWDG